MKDKSKLILWKCKGAEQSVRTEGIQIQISCVLECGMQWNDETPPKINKVISVVVLVPKARWDRGQKF